MLEPAVIQSLFELRKLLYPSIVDELDGVVRGDKGCAVWYVQNQHQIKAFERRATALGLRVRVHRLPDLDALQVHQLVATRPGEEWRAEVVTWVALAARQGPPSLCHEYMQSLAFGYTHEQAADWIAMRRHLSPVHPYAPIYFILRAPDAELIAESGSLHIYRPITIVALTLFTGGLHRDALTRLPPGYAIGRSALPRGTINEFFRFEPLRILIAECAVHRQRHLASKLLCPVDFWSGEKWSAEPTSS